ncbi:hypothetical protein [Pseudomonas helleri]|uniref:hypothetical protein n=1 Tax=Pseudomonas helleri TaxID=1608996 RepID=UPI0012974A05|nr:hypothetical protein [Pseudomonas helleri]MQT34682.1 hypothetical protein [Pseudomonas helleri]
MKLTARALTLNNIFDDTELSKYLDEGLSNLTNEQFSEAYEALVNDRELVLTMVNKAKAKHVTPASKALTDTPKKLADTPKKLTSSELTHKILLDKYDKHHKQS